MRGAGQEQLHAAQLAAQLAYGRSRLFPRASPRRPWRAAARRRPPLEQSACRSWLSAACPMHRCGAARGPPAHVTRARGPGTRSSASKGTRSPGCGINHQSGARSCVRPPCLARHGPPVGSPRSRGWPPRRRQSPVTARLDRCQSIPSRARPAGHVSRAGRCRPGVRAGRHVTLRRLDACSGPDRPARLGALGPASISRSGTRRAHNRLQLVACSLPLAAHGVLSATH